LHGPWSTVALGHGTNFIGKEGGFDVSAQKIGQGNGVWNPAPEDEA
jgi:hypothetical protein